MKEYTVYELEAGDKLYHVTDDNKIKEITLTEDHFVKEFDDNFYCYYQHDKSYVFIRKSKTNYYINKPKLRNKNERVPVYSLECECYSRDQKVYLIEAKDIKVYATRETAEKEVAKRKLAEFKEEFFANIYKAEIYDAISNRKLYESMQVKSTKAFDKFKKKIKELAKDGPVTVKIETLEGLTFTADEFKNYLQTQIAKLTDK